MTPSEKIALTSVIASGLVGVTGVLAAVFGGWRDRHAARSRAETERKQSRLAEAYVDVLDLTERVGYWASQLRPVSAPEDYKPPAPPTVADQTRVTAKLSAFGSPEVRALHKSWRACVNAIVAADLKVRLRLEAASQHQHDVGKAGEDLSWKDPLEPWGKIHDDYIPAEAQARAALIERVAKELS